MRMRLTHGGQCYAVGVLFAGIAVAFLLDRYPPSTASSASDFVAYFYAAGKQVLHGYLHYATPRVYTSSNIAIFRYPPIAAVFLAGFAWLPVKTAAIAWWIVGVALTALSAWWLTSIFAKGGQRVMVAGMLLLVFFAFAPLAVALPRQIDVWIVAIIAGAFVLSTRGTNRSLFAAGALLGLAASIKVYPLLAIAVIAWLRRDEARPLLAGAAICIVACMAIPFVLLGTAPLSQYADTLSTQSSPVLVAFPFAFGFLSVAYRALVATPYATTSAHLSPTLVKGLFVLFVVAVLVFVAVRFRPVRRARGAVWSVALIATAVCSPFLEANHLAPLVLIPVFLATDAATHSRPDYLPAVLADVWPIGVGFVACSFLSLALTLRPLAVLSLVISAGIGLYLLARRRRPMVATAIFGASMVFLGTPAFVNVSAFWSPCRRSMSFLVQRTTCACYLSCWPA